jgi:opacity protein-like surface antigen
MNAFRVALIISLIATSAFAQQPGDPDTDDSRERIGLRAGYVGTSSTLDDVFGSGLNLDLHWVQGIAEPVFLDFTLGAFYLGETDRDDITFDIFQPQTFHNVSMRVLRFTVAPLIELSLSERTAAYVSIGGGLYVISLLLDQSFFQFDLTDNHVGINVGAGVTRRITTNWFIDLHAEAHKFWTSTDNNDLFFRYSEGDQDPVFFEVTAGFLLRLF